MFYKYRFRSAIYNRLLINLLSIIDLLQSLIITMLESYVEKLEISPRPVIYYYVIYGVCFNSFEFKIEMNIKNNIKI